MALGDELALKQFEVLLDMQTKRVQGELKQLREEFAHAKEEILKALKDAHRGQEHASAYQGQFAPAQAPAWAQAPPQAWGPPQQGWQQPQGPPPQQQWGHAPPAQQWAQAPPQQQANKWAPPPEKPVSTQPIDRNNVAPSEVSIDKFFNFSGGARNK